MSRQASVEHLVQAGDSRFLFRDLIARRVPTAVCACHNPVLLAQPLGCGADAWSAQRRPTRGPPTWISDGRGYLRVSRPPTAGPFTTLPDESKREPWHGQSHVRSV